MQNGSWVTAGVTGFNFPKEAIKIEFRGQELVLIPGHPQEDSRFGDFYPLVAFNMPGSMLFEEGQRFIASFLSSVAWVRRAPVHAAIWAGGNLPRPSGGHDARIDTDDRFALDYLPEPSDKRTRMALALYREGMYLNNVAYQCLSFFKILNLVVGGSKEQITWIDTNLKFALKSTLHNLQEWEKKVNLNSTNQTAGEYLYGSNRCAVAHAGGTPTVDPDDPDDRSRLVQDLPMVQSLAEHLIESELGVKSAMAVWREHLYELQGFKELFGEELVARIIAGVEVPLDNFPTLPSMSIKLAFEGAYPSLEDMVSTVLYCAEGSVELQLNSPDGLTSLLLGLEFPAERFHFDLEFGVAAKDDGSSKAATNYADILRFKHRYFGNGSLEIWSGDKRIARKGAYLPENVNMSATDRNYKELISEAEAIAEQRNN